MAAQRLRIIIFPSIVLILMGIVCHAEPAQKSQIIPVEIFQVYELPVTVTSVELIKLGKMYELRCTVTNNSNEKLLGFRYSLVTFDADNRQAMMSRSEAYAITPYETKRRTIRTPLNIRSNTNLRVVVMFEQVVGTDSIWEVVKPKEALEAYLSGDYSFVPRVLKVANQVDAPERVSVRRLRF